MTLKANELRIGNYVSDIHAVGTFYAEVKKLDFSRCYYGQFNSDYSDLKPIPLTDEWLLNFDAIKIGYEFIFDRFRLKYRPDYKFYYVTCRETNAYITKVEFVHEWQNVVFALNNQELTLKNNLK